jgi:hypothetical protein
MSDIPQCFRCNDTTIVIQLPNTAICFECFIKLFYSQFFQSFNSEQKTNLLRSLRSMFEVLDEEYRLRNTPTNLIKERKEK